MDWPTAALRLSQCRHFLTLTRPEARLEVGHRVEDDVLRPWVGSGWRQPTAAERSFLIDNPAESGGWESAPAVGIRLFSIPRRLSRGFLAIEVEPAHESPSTRQSEQIQPLIAELTEFLEFIETPMRGSFSVRLEVGSAPDESASSGDQKFSPRIGSAGIGARVNVGEARCQLVYSPGSAPVEAGGSDSLAETLLARVDLYPGEGFFFEHHSTTALQVCALDGGSPLRLLTLLPT